MLKAYVHVFYSCLSLSVTCYNMRQVLTSRLPENIYFTLQIKLIDPVGTSKQTTRISTRVVNNVQLHGYMCSIEGGGEPWAYCDPSHEFESNYPGNCTIRGTARRLQVESERNKMKGARHIERRTSAPREEISPVLANSTHVCMKLKAQQELHCREIPVGLSGI